MISYDGTAITTVMLFGWLPVVVAIFSLMPPRRAVIAAFLFAWLFLPNATVHIQKFTDYNKMTATAMGVFIATMIFDSSRLLQFRPRIWDLAIVAYCFTPVVSSIRNGLGAYDGFSIAMTNIVTWGLPYFIGRIYFNDPQGLRELAIGVFIGGLIYVPLCLYEVRMSPQLHNIVYGFHPHSFAQSRRWGGWRPVVFMEHGLMVGMWMAMAALLGVWLWLSKGVQRIGPFPIAPLALGLAATALLVKSTGAFLLFLTGVAAFVAMRRFRTHWPLTALCIFSVLYVLVRGAGLWSGDQLVSMMSAISQERAESLEFRLRNENILSEKARQRPMFGWGGWGRNRVYNEEGRDITTTDGAWIITFGIHGIMGLLAQISVVLLGALLLRKRMPPALWSHPQLSAIPAIAAVTALWMIDNLFNNMFNPIFVLMCGGLIGLQQVALPQRRREVIPAYLQERRTPVVYSR